MSGYLLIASRDPFESQEIRSFYRLAESQGLAFGERRQTQPPRLLEDLTRFSHAGGTVYAVEEDFLERGIQQGEVVDGVSLVKTARLPALFHQFDQVWQW